MFLFESNREELINCVVDHEKGVVAFDQEEQMAVNLLEFGHGLKEVF